jgi:hypothetical protein
MESPNTPPALRRRVPHKISRVILPKEPEPLPMAGGYYSYTTKEVAELLYPKPKRPQTAGLDKIKYVLAELLGCGENDKVDILIGPRPRWRIARRHPTP